MKSYNIPCCSAEELVDILYELFLTAIRTDSLSKIPSVNLIGPMGVGKSSGVFELANKLSDTLGETIEVVDIRLLNFNPVDLSGIPFTDAEHKFAVRLKPKIFDLNPDKIWILFLDEISAAPQSMQATAYQIALDKRIGEFKLPDKCIVICAGNRTTDKSVAYRMPKALANRLMHFEITADAKNWGQWAVRNGIHEKVLGYIAFDNSKLVKEPDTEELAFPTPRSWEFVSRLLTVTGKEPEEIHNQIAACIGYSTTIEFEAWCSIYKSLPAVEDIFSGKYTAYPKSMDKLYALSSSMIARIRSLGEKLSDEELEMVCRYAVGFQPDFAVMFFRNILQIDGMNVRLMKIQPFMLWMRNNKKYI